MSRPPDSTPARSLELKGISFTHADIESVVKAFYAKVAVDPLLSVPFSSVTDWPHHVERLTHFWWVRLGGEPYMEASYDPVGKHFEAGFNRTFLTRWLELFDETVSGTLSQDKARLWNQIVNRMGEALTVKNEMYAAHIAKR